ncbi:hypothetical protein HPB51_004833 [Rhipicephalus microplus]|uniref:Uncharacterized protein n=1 Tax=Rhipicephalus microplus TaxID=6941 RepID=A0A9J6EF21_RHIMP|nr:hypothetical protein HPB51_004833 [Rhipicephalus microplus]
MDTITRNRARSLGNLERTSMNGSSTIGGDSALHAEDDSSGLPPPNSPDFHDDVNDHGEQAGPLVVVEGAFRDNLNTKTSDGCSHHAAQVEHARSQE